MEGYLKINDCSDRNELQELLANTKDAYFKEILRFCIDWLEGLEELKIKTSGSTGTPKVICLKREQLEASAKKTIAFFSLESQHTALLPINFKFIGGKMLVVRAIIAGMSLVVVKPGKNPFEELPDNGEVDFVSLVPLQVNYIIENGLLERLNTVNKGVLIGGASLEEEQERILREKVSVPIYLSYGMTETSSHIALRNLHKEHQKFDVLEGIKIGQDDRGCLWIEGDVTLSNRLETNDVVEISNSRSFQWLGRYDDVINSGGLKLFPEVLERKLKEVLDVLGLEFNFFISSIQDNYLGEKIVLVYEGEKLGKSQVMNIKQTASKQGVHKYELPKVFLNLKEFPLTESGKVDKRKALLMC